MMYCNQQWHKVWRVGAVLALGIFFLAGPVCAQQAPPDDSGAGSAVSTDAAAKPKLKDKTVLDLWNEGGVVMYFLALASVLMVGFTVEGFIKLRASKLAPVALTARLREAISAGNYQEAWQICESNRCFLSSVLSAGLERIGRSKDAVDFAIQETSLKESTILKTNTTYLSVIGVVSPMIGLTGTVKGMIGAFATLGSAGIGDPSVLSAKISEVLVATMGGLIIAIPAFVFYYILKAKAQNAVLIADGEIYRLLEDIPFDQVAGIRIGENFDSAATTARAARGTSQKVSMSLTTNCPACNFTIKPGTTPCPNCGTALDWAS